MAKNKISEWSATPANNTDVGGINIGEGMLPSDVNNAMREMMAQIKDQQAGTDGDNFTVGGNLIVTGTASITGDLTTTGSITAGSITGALTAANNLSDVTNTATARTNLGLTIGTNVQAYDVDIPTVSASQAEMEAGTEVALRSMSPLRVKQAITANSASAQSYRTRVLSTGTTYTVPSDVRALYVFVYGATGGKPANTASYAGRGGMGYSETYYATPAASYSYSIGAAGASTPTAGGTTTFGAMSVTGGGAVTGNLSGGTGGVGSGGTFNATGGAGGLSSTGIGGAGGAGSRAGNGGTGGNGGASLGGGGGGTGGNNASLATGGSAGTVSGSAISLAFFPSNKTETFDAGNSTTGANGADGGNSASYFNALTSGVFFSATGTSLVLFNASATLTRVPDGTGTDGIQGLICIVEVL